MNPSIYNQILTQSQILHDYDGLVLSRLKTPEINCNIDFFSLVELVEFWQVISELQGEQF